MSYQLNRGREGGSKRRNWNEQSSNQNNPQLSPNQKEDFEEYVPRGRSQERSYGFDGWKLGSDSQFVDDDDMMRIFKTQGKFKKPKSSWNRLDKWILVIVTLVSFLTRMYKIGFAPKVIWDEAHFGKFASFYLRGHNHHDVHPPLAKLLIALGGYLIGYDGSFDFQSNSTYPTTLNYSWLRAYVALYGIALVPLAYLITRKLKFPLECCILSTLMVLFDNGFIVITKFILLDGILLFFQAMTILSFVDFHNLQSKSFSREWWIGIVKFGTFMGLTCCVKWGVPLLLVTVIGLYVISDLWEKFTDVSMPTKDYVRHWLARIVSFIVIPVMIYLLMFRIHFNTLTQSSKEDFVMDSIQIAQLNGTELYRNSIDVAYNANVTLRATILNGALLHSHDFKLPPGSSGDQQVTGFREYDYNNYWNLRPVHPTPPQAQDPILVEDGGIVKFQHGSSGKFLRVQPLYASPKSGVRAYEVSASDPTSLEERYDQWQVKIYDDRQLAPKPVTVKAITSRIQLRNLGSNCLLASEDRHLPKWGFDQLEVNCVKNFNSTHVETLWNVEFNQHPQLPVMPKGYIRPRFWWDMFRVHHAMWSTNVGLVPDPDKYNQLASQPLDWPLVLRGIGMCTWNDLDPKHYMLGNPLVWWTSTFGVLLYPILFCVYRIRFRRRFREWRRADWDRFKFVGQVLYLGWAFAYLPFFAMSRVLYLHHYFPALYFACLLTPYTLHLTFHKLPYPTRLTIYLTLVALWVWSFFYFAPLTYGFDFRADRLLAKRWVRTWEFANPDL